MFPKRSPYHQSGDARGWQPPQPRPSRRRTDRSTYRRCPTSEPAHIHRIGQLASTSSIIGDKVRATLKVVGTVSERSDEGIVRPAPTKRHRLKKRLFAQRIRKAWQQPPPFTRTTAQAGNGLTGVTASPIPVIRQGTPAMQTGPSAPTDNPISESRIIEIETPKAQDTQRSRCVRRTAAKSEDTGRFFVGSMLHRHGFWTSQQSRCPKDQIIGISIVQPRGKRSVDAQRQIVAGLGDEAITVFREAHQTVQQMVTVVAAPADVKEEVDLSRSI